MNLCYYINIIGREWWRVRGEGGGESDGEGREVFTFPGLFHMESMWNPWNPSWIPCGMRMEWLIPHRFHMGSTWIPLDSIWNAGISTLDSMEQSIWIPWNKFNSMEIPLESSEKQPYLITKNSGNIENWTPGSTVHHVINQMSILSAALCNHLMVII